ncbi:MAG: ABC transporter ATP-binding protein [Lachnospiraceae bacterium]|nr:ABC transporter ATP-binding protein [Lachnospiraceae bacterium]
MLQVKNLSKIYRVGNEKIYALDKVNLTVNKGEFVAVMGSSGSGKSTLLHMIAGVDTPDAGEVVIGDVDIHRLSASEQAIFRRRNIGVIYQSYNLVPTLTVEENMILPLALEGKKAADGEVERLLEFLNLTQFRKLLPNQLSGGQQQRTAIGRAMLTKPRLLLADEPTGNLDIQNTKEVVKLLKQANEMYGQTILMVTHDLAVGKEAKRQIVMKDGCIVGDTVK